MRRRASLLVILAWAPAAPAPGNEALELLENTGRGAGSPRGAELLAGSGTPVRKESGGAADYTMRWLTHLPPLWLLYEDDSNPVVQAATLTGMFDWRLDTANIKPEGGGGPDREVDSSGARRARLGAVLRAFYNTDLEGGVVFDGDGDYHGLDKLKATVHVGDDLSLAFGKFRPPFSLEYTQDPGMRMVPELSPLTAQVVPANSLGVMVDGRSGDWEWGLGWFSGDVSRTIPDVTGDGYLLAKVGYTFQGPPGGETNASGEAVAEDDLEQDVFQRWHLDYIYNLDKEGSRSIPGGYEHLLATGIQTSHGRFDFLGDFLLANGKDQTAWGLTLQGAYWLLEDAVRAVVRYSYGDTDEPGGLMMGWGVPSPDSDSVHPFRFPVVETGDESHSFYGGLNFHVLGDHVVIQVGGEYRLLKNAAAGVPDLGSWLWQFGGRAAF